MGDTTGLYHFLLQFRVEKGCDFTHTSFARPSGAFYIPGQRMDEMMALYKTAIAKGDEVFLTEKHREIGPAIVDLDFRFDLDDNEIKRRYTDEMIDAFVKLYASTVAKYVDVEEFDIYVMEKPSGPTIQKTLVKDGIHLTLPGIVTRPSLQHMIRNEVLAGMKEVFAGLPLVNRFEDVLDEAVIDRNNWLMYKSKKTGGVPYEVTRVLRYYTSDDKLLSSSPSHDLVETLSIRNKIDASIIKKEFQNVVADFERQMDERRKRKELVQTVMSNTPSSSNNVCENLEVVGLLVDVLDPLRGDAYNDWVRVGWCLRNIDHRLLEKWIEFSRKSPKYIEGECARMWAHMRMGGLSIGTLHMWARTDSPERYKEIIRNDLSDLIHRSVSGTHYDIARVVHQMYRYEYVCASIRNRTWYEFREHRWHNSDSACSLRKRISSDVFREYTQYALFNQQKAVIVEADEDQKASWRPARSSTTSR